MSTITKPIFLDETGQAMVSALQSLAAITSGFVGAPGSGFPSGGSTGQILVKASSSDYDAAWSSVSPQDIGAEPSITEVTISSAGDITQSLDAGKIYHFTGELTSLTLTLNTPGNSMIPIYHFNFDSGSTAPTVAVSSVSWQGGSFTPQANKHYEVNILNGYGVNAAW